MRCVRSMAGALLVSGLVGCGGLAGAPAEHGPGWIGRSADTLVEKMGSPDRSVRLPEPSQSTVYLYTGGAVPGFAICERNYYIRGGTVIGFREHGSDASCNRTGGRTE